MHANASNIIFLFMTGYASMSNPNILQKTTSFFESYRYSFFFWFQKYKEIFSTKYIWNQFPRSPDDCTLEIADSWKLLELIFVMEWMLKDTKIMT